MKHFYVSMIIYLLEGYMGEEGSVVQALNQGRVVC